MHKSLMKAKLVTAAITVRVIVPDGATESEIIQASKGKFIYAVNAELGDYVYDIDDDNEFPFGTIEGDDKN